MNTDVNPEATELLPASLEAWLDLRREIEGHAREDQPWQKWTLGLIVAVPVAAGVLIQAWLNPDHNMLTYLAVTLGAMAGLYSLLENRMNRRWKLLLKVLQARHDVAPPRV